MRSSSFDNEVPPGPHSDARGSQAARQNFRRARQVCKDSLLERDGFEPVWGFSCQVVVSGFLPVLCSEPLPVLAEQITSAMFTAHPRHGSPIEAWDQVMEGVPEMIGEIQVEA